MEYFSDSECLDGPHGCGGEVFARESLSGSGAVFVRCDNHFDGYAARVGPRIAEIRRHYPDSATPPSWFDPAAAGESWDEP